MAEKRRFYNSGDWKGLTKKDLYEAVAALADGEDLDENIIEFVKAACDYELETLAIAAAKPKKAGEHTDPLQSDYAKALRAAVMPFITGNPQTIADLQEKMTAAGKVSTSGKPFSIPWIGRVLNSETGIVKTQVIVEKVGKDGLKAQVQATAYKRQ